jgi:hypothetical protein
VRASAESDAPRRRIEEHALVMGQPAFAIACARILDGADAEPELLKVLAGRAASWFVSREDDTLDYWQRVWAARGLLWAWHDVALSAVTSAMDDEAWRVREMVFKVAARYRLGDALDSALRHRDDDVARVRAAANRAISLITAEGA